MASSKYEVNYQLPSLENQEYLFREKFFQQELILYQEDKPLQVFIIYLLYI